MDLNPEQLDVVRNADGPALVVAGPGSGKTRTLVYRVCKLLADGEDPRGILLLTFTNKAAREMKARMEGLAGEKARHVTAGTFHHFANLLIRQHPSEAGLRPNFTIMDEEDSTSLIRRIASARYAHIKKGAVDEVRKAISLSKLRMVPLDELLEGPEFQRLQRAAEEVLSISKEYEIGKKSSNCVDFDDLLVLARKLLADGEIGGMYRKRFRNILVDEFQDTDRLQASILELLHEKGKNLLVVGDDCQSIYSFRGAEIRNMLDFRERYGAKLFLLVRNYRSSSSIVSFINKCIQNSKAKLDKELLPVLEGGELPELLSFEDRVSEARAVSDRIQSSLAEGKTVGVLFRSAYLCSELELELSRRGVPYELRGGVRFFEQRHIKDMVSLVKAYLNPSDSVSLMRLFMLFPRIGEKSAAKACAGLSEPAEVVRALERMDKGGAFSTLVSEAFSLPNAAAMLDSFYGSFYKKYLEENFEDQEERKADIEVLVGAAARYPDAKSFLDAFSLEADSRPGKDSKLVLSTIHQAKGLEWDSVILIGLADGMLPSGRADDLEEERRLFYVAASRAKMELLMTYPRSSGRFYEFAELPPSRFLMELPESSFRVGP